jgi:hypothetical protein
MVAQGFKTTNPPPPPPKNIPNQHHRLRRQWHGILFLSHMRYDCILFIHRSFLKKKNLINLYEKVNETNKQKQK